MGIFNHSAATNLKPEDTRSWEIGLNARLWNHFSIDATYYHSNTYNQTFNITLASSSGYSSAIVQTGNIQNYGLELALGYNNTWGDFSWNSSLTYTMNRNKVKRLASGATNPITGEIIDMPERVWLCWVPTDMAQSYIERGRNNGRPLCG